MAETHAIFFRVVFTAPSPTSWPRPIPATTDDPVNLMFSALRVALADYSGMHIATDLSDVFFGTPQPVATEANLGVLDAGKVNIAVHGHNPLLSEMVVKAAKELEDEAKAAGAGGINVVGICCTGNEVLMRHGVPLATSFGSTELAIVTGALDAMVVDVQCIMPSIRQVAECYHTRIITTSNIAKIPGSYHIDFHTERAMDDAKAVVRLAIQAYQERDPAKVQIPEIKSKVIGGFSLEAIMDIFAAVNPERLVKVLTDAILDGEIKGVVLFCGCNNLRTFQDNSHITMVKELLKNDVFVVATGCSSQAFAKQGILSPEGVEEYAGPSLKAFLGRIQEKADLNMPPRVGTMPPVEGSSLIYSIITQIAHDVYGGHFMFEMDPEKAAAKIMDALEYRTWKLGVHQNVAERYETPLVQGY